MRTTSEPSHDPAPLLWVRGEIELSLAKARENLDLVSADSGDAKAIQAIAADLHQVTGALLMVGLGAAARLTDEIEKLVDTFKEGVPADAVNRVQIAKEATMSLSKYLDSLVAGAPDRPMELAASYVMLNRARGATDASPNDLFSPDLSAAGPDMTDGGLVLAEVVPVEVISRCRGMYQAGLLKLVRNKDLAGGALHMCDAVLALEALDATAASRTFWFTTVGFLEAVANDPAGAGSLAVQLFVKIDQQIKRLTEGNHNVPEKLFRDLLLVIGRSAARTDRIKQIREIYRLDDLLSFPDSRAQDQPDKRLIPIVDALRDQIRGMKDEFLRFTSGRISALEPLTKQAAALATIGQQLPNREMVRLLQLLGAVGRHMGKTGARPTEVQGLEIATALLFVEASLEDYFKLTSEFDQQAASISSRIHNAMTGAGLPDFNRSVASLSDTMTLQAQTHLLVFQVGREVQANLAMIESALDDFFRDAAKIAGLAAVENLFKQVRGAFFMLEENDAAALAGKLAERVAQFASGAVKGEGEEAGAVAEGVSALGLYVDGLQRGSPDARAMLLPALMSFGIAKKLAPVKRLHAKTPVAKAVAEAHKEEHKEEHKEAHKEAHEEAAEPPRAEVPKPEALRSTRQDAAGVPKKAAGPALHEATAPRNDQASDALVRTAAVKQGGAVKAGEIDGGLSPTAPAAPRSALPPSSPPGELERLMRSEKELRAGIADRDQRIRSLQVQMVALHKEAMKVAALQAELKELRAALAKVEKKAH